MAHTLETTQAWNNILKLVRPPDASPAFDSALWAAVLKFAATLPPPQRGTKPVSHTARNTAGDVTRSGVVWPFKGEKNGVPLEELETKDVEWWLNKAEADHVDPSKAKWRDKNRAQLAALRAEMETR